MSMDETVTNEPPRPSAQTPLTNSKTRLKIAPEKVASPNHVDHTFHQNNTTKTPRSGAGFPQKAL